MSIVASATVVVPVSPERLFAYLADLENHWRLSNRFDVRAIDEDGLGATVRVRGPFGLSRTARTRVEGVDAPHAMHGSAVSDGSTGRVRWTFESHARDGARVTLTLWLDTLALRDRALVALGARRWLVRELRKAARTAGAQAAAVATP